MTLKEIRTQFIDGYIELSNPLLDDNVYLTIDAFRQSQLPMRLDMTFEYWLSYIGNRTIDAPEQKPDYTSALVKFRNAYQCDYKIDLCNRKYAPDANIVITNKQDLYVRKEGVDLNALHNRCLTTVNGYLHPCVPYYGGISVIGGGMLHKQLGSHQVGIMSFSDIGDITQIALTKERITKVRPELKYSDKALIDLGLDITNKSLIVSIGGYLVTDPNIVKVVSAEGGLIAINTKRFDMIRHINDQIGEIDLTPCGIVTPDHKGFIPLHKDALLDDIVALQYLTLPQSFVAVIDTPVMTTETIPVTSTGVMNRRISTREPNLPIIDTNGRIKEYWIDRQNICYSLNFKHGLYHHYLFETDKQSAIGKHVKITQVGKYFAHDFKYLKMVSVKVK